MAPRASKTEIDTAHASAREAPVRLQPRASRERVASPRAPSPPRGDGDRLTEAGPHYESGNQAWPSDDVGPAPPVPQPEMLAADRPVLRWREPTPVIPWLTRGQEWLRRCTSAGRTEAVYDAALTDLLARLATGTRTLAAIGPKGGAGKSTTALVAGLVLAQVPLARPILVEVNPDWGTLDELLGAANPAHDRRTAAGLHRDRPRGHRPSPGLRHHVRPPAGPDRALRPRRHGEAHTRDYDRVLRLLALHYNVILLDCGTAFTQRLNQFAIQRADHLVVVGWPEQATMRKTLAAVDYLASARYERDYRGLLAEVADGAGHGDILRAPWRT